MSHRAVMGALLISHYRHDPRYQQAYQLLTKLIDLDAHMNKWRCKFRQETLRVVVVVVVVTVVEVAYCC